MKYSIFNNTLTISSAYGLIYNAYTNIYVLLKIDQYHTFLNSTPNQLKEHSFLLYKQLLKAGCIIDNNINESQLLCERIKQVDNQQGSYILTINPTMSCNFKCWYCYETHLKRSEMSPEMLEYTKKFITKRLSKYNCDMFHLSFFGGEPLLYYQNIVRPLVQHLIQESVVYNIPYSIGFTSNGYLLNDKIVEELKKYRVSSFQITLDGGKKAHNKVRYTHEGNDSYTKIVENVKKLLHVGISVVLRINYTIDNLSTVGTIINDFRNLTADEKKFLQVDLQRVWQDSNSNNTILNEDLLEKYMLSFKDIGIPVSAPIMDQVWNPCYADKTNQAVINYNGDVFKCTARDFTRENRLGVLNEDGTIKWDEKKMKQREGVRLSKDVCKQCRIAPICGGTCTQRGLDSGNSNQCIRGLDESGKDKIVLNQFYYNIVKNGVSI